MFIKNHTIISLYSSVFIVIGQSPEEIKARIKQVYDSVNIRYETAEKGS